MYQTSDAIVHSVHCLYCHFIHPLTKLPKYPGLQWFPECCLSICCYQRACAQKLITGLQRSNLTLERERVRERVSYTWRTLVFDWKSSGGMGPDKLFFPKWLKPRSKLLTQIVGSHDQKQKICRHIQMLAFLEHVQAKVCAIGDRDRTRDLVVCDIKPDQR